MTEEEHFLCDCCGKEVEESDLSDCEVCSHWMCKECMWGDEICRCHFEE